MFIFSGKIGARLPASLLIDSGASYNFIADSFIAKHRLTTIPLKGPTIQLADGTLHEISRALSTTVRIGTYVGKLQAYALPLQGSYDVILGTPWLTDTNPFINWSKRTLTIHQNGQFITLNPEAQPERGRSPFLSLIQVQREVRTGAKVFLAAIRRIDDPVRENKIGALDSLDTSLADATTRESRDSPRDSPREPTREPPPDYPPEIQAAVDRHVKRLKEEYADVMPPELPKELPPHRPGHDFKIELVPGAKPPNLPYYRLSYEEEAECRRQIEDGLKHGFIRPSNSPWGSPVLFVKKKDGNLRMCIDFRAVNQLTIKRRTALPRMDELLDRMTGARYYTAIDLRSAYNQLRMDEASIPMTAFKTKWGLFEYTVLSFGLCNAPASFQALMTDIFRAYLDQWMVLFIDDLLAWDQDLEEHAKHVEIILQTLRKHRLYIKESKCEWFKPEVEFLGHRVSREGVKVDEKKITAVTAWPAPGNVAELRSFLGMAGYYRHFVRRFAHSAAPLTDLLKKDRPWTWGPIEEEGFEELKHKLTTAPVLAFPDPTKPFTVTCDASSRAIGAVLSQDQGKGSQPIAYFSRKLSSSEQNYAAWEREMLALIEALRHWRHYLRGAVRNQAYTDHKSLTYFASQRTLSHRQARWMGILQEYNVYIDYLPGKSNLVADALSRRPDLLTAVTTVHTLGDFLATLKSSYGNDDESTTILKAVQDGTSPGYTLKDGLILRSENEQQLLYIPPSAASLRKQLLAEHHDSALAGHLGQDKTLACLSRNFWWPTMRQDVRDYIRTCPCCQVNKSRNRPPGGLLQPLPIPEVKWESTSMDFITKLPTTADGCDAIMAVVERLSKMVHLIPTRTTATAPEIAELYFNYVTKLHGLQKSIISDRDSKFTSRFWEELTKLWDTRLGRSTAYHPQTDGQTERTNRVLQEVLRAYVSERHHDWDKRLAAAEFAINNAPSASTGESPFYLNYGFHPLTPATLDMPRPDRLRSQAAADFISKMNQDLAAAKASLERAQERQARYANTKRREESFEEGDQVLLSTDNLKLRSDGPATKFNPRWCGPFKILEKIGQVAYRLDLPSTMRIHPVFHVSLLKPYLAPTDDERSPPPPPPPIAGADVYEAERISNRRTITVNGKQQVQYLVHWRGYPDYEATWEPSRNLLGKTVQAWKRAIDQAMKTSTQETTEMPRTGQTALQAAATPTEPATATAAPPSPAAPAPTRQSTRIRRKAPTATTAEQPTSELKTPPAKPAAKHASRQQPAAPAASPSGRRYHTRSRKSG